MNPSTALAKVVVDELIRCGVRDAVVSPGSRNAPLSLALHDADAAGRLRLHVRIDERTAAFLALGLARGSGRVVPVVCTSGTAATNFLPAVTEAHHDGVPLLALTADRPGEWRDIGGNQVIDQVRLYGSAVRFFHELGTPERGQNAYWRTMVCRAIAAAVDGPVHLNVPLREPLLPDDDEQWPEPLDGRADGAPWTTWTTDSPAPQAIEPGERTLVVVSVGQETPPWAHGLPVIAETGGAGHADVLTTGVWLLREAGLPPPSDVVSIGRTTLFRPVQRLLSDASVSAHVVGGWAVSGHQVTSVGRLSLDGAVDDSWAKQWSTAETLARQAIDAVIDSDGLTGLRLARDLVDVLPPDALLVLGSSQSIRDVGLAARSRPDLRIVANRGVAGIDGTTSTAIGAALGATGGHAYALVGDLTFLHDLTGLIIGPGEPRPDLTIVVANNDGGAIFGLLEQGEPQYAESFERVFGTPHGADLEALCAGLGASYERVSTVDAIGPALLPGKGIRVVDVTLDRHSVLAQHDRVAAAVRGAVR